MSFNWKVCFCGNKTYHPLDNLRKSSIQLFFITSLVESYYTVPPYLTSKCQIFCDKAKFKIIKLSQETFQLEHIFKGTLMQI